MGRWRGRGAESWYQRNVPGVPLHAQDRSAKPARRRREWRGSQGYEGKRGRRWLTPDSWPCPAPTNDCKAEFVNPRGGGGALPERWHQRDVSGVPRHAPSPPWPPPSLPPPGRGGVMGDIYWRGCGEHPKPSSDRPAKPDASSVKSKHKGTKTGNIFWMDARQRGPSSGPRDPKP